MRNALISHGIDPRAYAGHSFRISAATTAARAGLKDSLIQTLEVEQSYLSAHSEGTPHLLLECFGRNEIVVGHLVINDWSEF